MKNLTLTFSLLLFSIGVFAQKSYEDSLRAFLYEYVQKHEVVKGKDKELLSFYDVDRAYCVTAAFQPSTTSDWLTFKTSGTRNKLFKLYGTLSFELNGKACRLNLYQSQDLMTNPEYRDNLFLPFTDSTTGNETYESGRYIDLKMSDVKNGRLTLDFNKAYNPYCAYVSGVYNCPIPPKENALPVAVRAGERTYGKKH